MFKAIFFIFLWRSSNFNNTSLLVFFIILLNFLTLGILVHLNSGFPARAGGLPFGRNPSFVLCSKKHKLATGRELIYSRHKPFFDMFRTVGYPANFTLSVILRYFNEKE